MWIYNNEILETLPEDVVGFVYRITRISDGKLYIGKKATSSRTRALKTVTLKSGEKKKKKVTTVKESDWKKYFGSSDELKADVKELGQEAFKREILHFCYSKAECSYLEVKEQIFHKVMETNHSYNRWISFSLNKSHLTKSNFYDL